jgi:RNA polymerase sigma-70 factor (sigma-E family)
LAEDLSAFVSARYVQLRRTAYLLCGDWHRAEDLVQTALARVVVAARRRQIDCLDAYTRQVLLRAFLSDRTRAWRRWERSWPGPVEVSPSGDDPTTAIVVLAALGSLPPRQRAVVVLRFWEDRSIEETAQALRVSPGTVKSQTAKALATLRAALGDIHSQLTC